MIRLNGNHTLLSDFAYCYTRSRFCVLHPLMEEEIQCTRTMIY